MYFFSKQDKYNTPDFVKQSLLSRLFPGIYFYVKLAWILVLAANRAKKGRYTDENWIESSYNVVKLFENIGCKFVITGKNNFINLKDPCVFIGNHMSTLESFVLPSIIHPHKKITFLIKQDLLHYPLFKYVMRSRDPIAVTRKNPRKDFRIVMERGQEKLNSGYSIIVFPQTTRSYNISFKQFNSIGIKLAKKAKVPVIPMALKTDAWGIGRIIKEIGPIKIKKIFFSFGEPISVEEIQKDPKKIHRDVFEFIEKKLKKWKQV